jgi:type III secretion system FlhB-like substrate exporter
MSGKRVVGVQYDESKGVPVVILKGAHEEADAILKDAAGHPEIPVVKSAQLTEQLYRTPIDAPVDRALFPVMAALLVHVVDVDARLQENRR